MQLTRFHSHAINDNRCEPAELWGWVLGDRIHVPIAWCSHCGLLLFDSEYEPRRDEFVAAVTAAKLLS